MIPLSIRRDSRARWVPPVIVAVWVAVVLLAGCSSQRLPDHARAVLTVTARESAADLARRGKVREGYRRTLDAVCSVIEADAREGRGWDWLVGLAGMDSGPDGRLDAETAKACGGGV